MTEAAVKQALEELAKALVVVGVLPWWAYPLIIVVLIPLFFAWYHVSLTWPPGWNTPPDVDAPGAAPPIPVQPDGAIHLQQEPPKEWL